MHKARCALGLALVLLASTLTAAAADAAPVLTLRLQATASATVFTKAVVDWRVFRWRCDLYPTFADGNASDNNAPASGAVYLY